MSKQLNTHWRRGLHRFNPSEPCAEPAHERELGRPGGATPRCGDCHCVPPAWKVVIDAREVISAEDAELFGWKSPGEDTFYLARRLWRDGDADGGRIERCTWTDRPIALSDPERRDVSFELLFGEIDPPAGFSVADAETWYVRDWRKTSDDSEPIGVYVLDNGHLHTPDLAAAEFRLFRCLRSNRFRLLRDPPPDPPIFLHAEPFWP